VCRECEKLLAEEAEEKSQRPGLKLDSHWPKDLPLRKDHDGVSWADYRPDKSDTRTHQERRQSRTGSE